ncbi:MAG: PD-(D/E)XK nuclease family protein [Bacteroidales bacterium]|nr:PD-(D/E)XK nuclease family protein [Bacteroidales bacterium]
MTPFLKQVALHYFTDGNPGRLCFVFPNKRAIGFFKKYLGELVASKGIVMMSPECYTMNDFFCQITGSHLADRIKQLILLYECYCSYNKNAETLDDFLYWGGIMLSDFNDVDKYLADPGKLWKNVEEFKSMQDLSFLEKDQAAALSQFLRTLEKDGPVKRDFLQIWNILLPLYRSFNEKLSAEGLSYEGGVYRKLAEDLDKESVIDILGRRFEPGTRFVFTGLNALNECEKKLLGRMKKAGVAEFCWDFSSKEIRDPQNMSSFFMARNLEEFGQALEPDSSSLKRPEINVMSVSSSIGQAKQLPAILGRIGAQHDIRTAIVLPDEGLLIPVLNSIPKEIKDINVTMGYPMQGSDWLGLIGLLGPLQLNARGNSFYHKQVWGIFSNGVFLGCLSEKELALVDKIKTEARFYISEETFAVGGLMQAVFTKTDDKASYLRNIILKLTEAMREDPTKAIELEFAMQSWKTLVRLQELAPPVTDKTWWKLLMQMLSSLLVPFNGEPLRGMQIMGPLETRALDFNNLIILSVNEGLFPRRAVASSFIPPELRKGFGLPTYEYQDAIWAYYFYRLIQRAEKVWLLFDSRTEVSRSGEESRYIKQLELLYDFKINRFVASAPIESLNIPDTIEKTEEDLAVIQDAKFHLSASALRSYLNCPVSFYYSKIKNLGEPDEVQENLDAGMLGNVVHQTMHALYSGNPDELDEKRLVSLSSISRDHIKGILSDKDTLRSRIRERIKLQLGGSSEIVGRNLVYEEIIFRCVKRILECDLELLDEKKQDSFEVIGLEQFHEVDLGGFKIVGYIDRLDSFDEGTIRIVDYKTGHVTDEEMALSDQNADKVVKALFAKDKKNKDRPGIALQIYIYDRMMDKDRNGRKVLNSIYHTSRLFSEGVRTSEPNGVFESLIETRLTETLDEIRDISTPWRRTVEKDNCKFCDFKTICGR